MGENGGVKEKGLEKYEQEARLPGVLSNYMRTDNLPDEYKGIDGYIKEVRQQLIREAGGKLSQLQMMVLDGICEVMIVLKYVSAYISGAPAQYIVSFDKFGNPMPSDLVARGFSNLHQVLDKKIKQFHEMTREQKDEMSASEIHRRAIMGEHIPTGRPKGGQKHNVRDGESGRFLKSAN